MRRSLTARQQAGLAVLALTAGLGVLLLNAPALAASPSWSAMAGPTLPQPDHAIIWQLAADPAQPADMLAATSRGVFHSTDGGQHWGPTSISAFSWTVTFAAGGAEAYVGTESQGVYRSTDSGTSWQADNAGLASLDIRAISVAPDAVVLGTNSGVYVSGTGLGWDSAGLTGTTISSLAVISISPLGVLAGSDSKVASPNLFSNLAVGSSTSWQQVGGGDPQDAPVFSVAAGPLARGAANQPILVGTLKGLLLSTNGGALWQQVTLGQGALWSVNAITFDPENPQVVYVGGDNGGSTGGGLQRSVNGGTSWGPWELGLPATGVTGLWADPTNPVTLLAALWNGNSREAATARMVDTSAPGPVPLQAVSATSPIPISPPPTEAPTAAPTPRRSPGAAGRFTVPAWGPPILAAIIVILIVGTVMGLRRRRTRLDAEAPP